jgi:hypothetical protein
MAGFLWSISALFGLGGMLLAITIIGWQSFVWLKSGKWPLLLVQDAFTYISIDPPSTDWVGLQKLITDVLESSLSVGVFVGGLVVGIISASCAETLENYERERQKKISSRKRTRLGE